MDCIFVGTQDQKYELRCHDFLNRISILHGLSYILLDAPRDFCRNVNRGKVHARHR
jgi:hypothetical protein